MANLVNPWHEEQIARGHCTLILMVGLPRSGKSTKARTMGFPIVNPDAIRLALYGERWRVQGERMVWTMAHYMVEALFGAGHQTVVLDATNVTEARREEWVNPKAWVTGVCVIDTPAAVCIERAHASGFPDLAPVIKRMAAGMEPVAEYWPRV